MRTLGLIGGMSWESTASYYRGLNEAVRDRLGGLHSARLVLWSVDFAPLADMQARGDWDAAEALLVDAARRLEQAGAEAVMICTNTMHKAAEAVAGAVNAPLLHIADATGAALARADVRRPLLLGTRFTMEQQFYRGPLAERFGIDVVVPPEAGRNRLHAVIYDELCRGDIRPASRDWLLAVVNEAAKAGADGVILGCTELGLLLSQSDSDRPVFDTTLLHIAAGADFALSDSQPVAVRAA